MSRDAGLRMTEDGRFQCTRCDEIFAEEFVFGRHETVCNAQNAPLPKYKKGVDGSFYCTVRLCGSNQAFPSLFSLRKHFFASHVSEEDLKFPCEYCGQRFAR